MRKAFESIALTTYNNIRMKPRSYSVNGVLLGQIVCVQNLSFIFSLFIYKVLCTLVDEGQEVN